MLGAEFGLTVSRLERWTREWSAKLSRRQPLESRVASRGTKQALQCGRVGGFAVRLESQKQNNLHKDSLLKATVFKNSTNLRHSLGLSANGDLRVFSAGTVPGLFDTRRRKVEGYPDEPHGAGHHCTLPETRVNAVGGGRKIKYLFRAACTTIDILFATSSIRTAGDQNQLVPPGRESAKLALWIALDIVYNHCIESDDVRESAEELKGSGRSHR
ncbi:hypothetical protein B0H17DRAFT_1155141 [Mycena rosella]|uniref:Uncharacterized protein n=1 Tax=Mycena rosella TaxID=1033263 RepID=A0AAD7AX61_MYCRO|nr:hypothetical protein B0H17DRAFT_1155141 [Mycena rosella]